MDDSLSASMKQCPRCKEWKPLTSEFFYPKKSSASGFNSACKVCVLTKVPSVRNSIFNQDGCKQCTKCKEFFPETLEFFGKKAKGRNGLDSYCKKCRHEYKRAEWAKEHPPKPKEVPDGFKKCTVCMQILPATLEYFHAMSKNKDGLRTPCKKCCASRVAHPRTTKCYKPGYKICCKCLKELPTTSEFFHKHPATLDKFSPSCKQCYKEQYRALHPRRILVNDAPDGYKRCSVCRQDIPAKREYFHRLRSERDGLQRICKKCIAKIRKEQRLRRIDEARAHERAMHRKNAEYYRKYHEINHERIKARGRQHYWDRREYYLQYGKEYRKRPSTQIKRRVRDHNRRSRNRSVQGKHTPQQIQDLLKRQHYRCYYAACGHSKFARVNGKYVYHIEHTYPLKQAAGTDIPANDISMIVLACPSCNLSKGSKAPWEWPEGGRLL